MRKNVKNGLIGALTTLIIVNRNKLSENNSKIAPPDPLSLESADNLIPVNIISKLHSCAKSKTPVRCWFIKNPFGSRGTYTFNASNPYDYFKLNPDGIPGVDQQTKKLYLNPGKHRFYFININGKGQGLLFQKNGVYIWTLQRGKTYYIYPSPKRRREKEGTEKGKINLDVRTQNRSQWKDIFIR